MKSLLFLLCLPAFAAVPVVSSIVTDDINVDGGHSSVRVTWSSDVAADNLRIAWGTTSAYGNLFWSYNVVVGLTAGEQIILTGQTAGATIHLCPQSHNASGWSDCTGLDQAITFPALPSPHPTPATLPSTFSLEPDMSGAIALTANSVATLQTAIDTAVAGQCSNKYIITISGSLNGRVIPGISCDVDQFASVDTTADTITLATTKSTYHNGDQVRIMTSDFLAGFLPAPLLEGISYCAASVSGATMQLTPWPACSGVIDLTTAGSGDHHQWMRPFPVVMTNYIQLKGNGSVPPAGIRPDPSWDAAWPTIHFSPPTNASDSWPIRFEGTNANFYVGPGLHFTLPASNQTTTTDPVDYLGWIKLDVSSANIAVKRNVFTGGYPERIFHPIDVADGSYIDVSDNYWENVSYFRPTNYGMIPSTTFGSTTATVAAGHFFTSLGSCTLPSFTLTNPTIAGTGFVYISLNMSTCLPLASLPAGASVTMSVGTTTIAGNYPVNGSGLWSQGLIGSCFMSANTFASCSTEPDSTYSVPNSEGPQIGTFDGPGPYNVRNNYFESHGIFWHFNDDHSSTPTRFPQNMFFARNVFNSPLSYIVNATGNNGATYKNRNQWEAKRGQYMWLDGNRFFGEYADINAGPSILINHQGRQCAAIPCVGSRDSDFTATNNYFANNAGCFQLGGGPPDATRVPPLGRRFTIRNNTCTNVNGYTWASPQGVINGRGFCFYLTFGGEDVIIDHNTCYSMGGFTSVWAVPVAKFVEGLSVTNNIFFFNEDQSAHGISVDWGQSGVGTPTCQTLTGKLALDCYATPTYTWSNNLVFGGFTSTPNQSGNSSASAIATAYTGLTNTFLRAEATVAGRIAAIGMWNPTTPSTALSNFRWRTSSPYIAGGGSASTDGSDLGANQDIAQDAQGLIKNVRALSISATGFTVDFHSPDTGTNCYIGYGTGTDPSAWTVTSANTQTVKERSIAVTGTAGKTVFQFQVWCAGTEPSATQTVRTL